MDASDRIRLLVAGGGTGGHLFPAIAVVQELETQMRISDVLFVGTSRGIEAREIPRLGYRLECIPVGGLVGKRLSVRIKNLMQLPLACVRSLGILRSFRPQVVLGVGGYASGPTVMTAFTLSIPVLIQEQNLVPGFTNKVLGRVARKVAVSFEETIGFFGSKAVLTGNPVRREFLSVRPRPRGRMNSVLVFGGSQGATRINRALVEALPKLKGAAPNIVFHHQTGPADQAWVEQAYREAGVNAKVVPFIHEMAKAMEAADIVVSRAGASTISELLAAGRAAVLIPLASSAGGHQEKNAGALERRGVATVIPENECDANAMARVLVPLMADAGLVDKMSGRQDGKQVVDGAGKVAELLYSLGRTDKSKSVKP